MLYRFFFHILKLHCLWFKMKHSGGFLNNHLKYFFLHLFSLFYLLEEKNVILWVWICQLQHFSHKKLVHFVLAQSLLLESCFQIVFYSFLKFILQIFCWQKIFEVFLWLCFQFALLQGIKTDFEVFLCIWSYLVELTIWARSYTAGNKPMMRFSCLVEIWKGRGGGGLYAANACELFSPDINYDYLTYIISCLFNCSNYLGYDGKATETYCLHIWRKNRHILAKQEANCKVFIRDPCNQGILHDVVCLILVYHITKTRPPDIPCSGELLFHHWEMWYRLSLIQYLHIPHRVW